MAANLVGAGVDRVAGRYLLQAPLGRGAEGETFAAIDERDQRRVAVKLFAGSSPAVAARVRFEFERLASLRHPSLVRVLDVGRHGERPFMVTELVDGDDLSSLARVSDAQVRRVGFERLAIDVADALACLHARGIVHGDVSPENIRLTAEGRAVLMDLGATAFPSTGGATGTLGFAAPEALVGAVGPAADLFGLGATLFFAWTGEAPFGRGVDAVTATLAGGAPRPSEIRPGLSAPWDQLIGDLLGATPTDRPSSARQVLLRVTRMCAGAPTASSAELLPPHPAGDPLAGLFVGRGQQRGVLSDALVSLGDGGVRHSVVALVGVEGSGRRTLLDLALQDQALRNLGAAQSFVDVWRGDLNGLAAWLSELEMRDEAADVGLDGDPEHRRHAWFARVMRALETRAARTPICVALCAGTDEEAFAAFVGGAPPSGRLLLLVPARQPIGRVGATELALGPLQQQEVSTLVERALGEELPAPIVARVLARVFEVSGGHAATTAHLVRQLVTAHREGAVERFVPIADAGLDGLLSVSWAGLPAAARRYSAAVALGLTAPPDAQAAASAAAAEPARAAGWVTGDPLDPRTPTGAHQAVIMRALASPELRDVTLGALAAPPAGLPETDGRRGLCLEALGQIGPAVAAFRRAAAIDTPKGGGEARACQWLARAATLVPDALTADERIRLANRLSLEGRHQEAIRALSANLGGSSMLAGDDQVRLEERRAWLHARMGNLDQARAILEQAIAATDTAAARLARARLARVLVGLHRFADALSIAQGALADPVAGPLAVEASLLAYAYAGDLPAARALLATGPATALPPLRARFLTSLVAQLSGQLPAALGGYQEALGLADDQGDVHTAAAIALNLGAVAAEAGNYAMALNSGERAIRELGRIGAIADLSTALFNAGILLVELGDLPGAGRIVARLRNEQALHSGASEATASYLSAEIATRRGDDRSALPDLVRVAGNRNVNPAVQGAAQRARVDALARLGRVDEALSLLTELEGASPTGEPELRLCRARTLLASRVGDVDAVLGLAQAMAQDAAQAEAEGRRPRAWRAALLAARLMDRVGRTADAQRSFTVARRLFEEVSMSTPIDHRPGLEQAADAGFFFGTGAGLANPGVDAAAHARATRNEGRLRRLLRINKRLNSELRLPRLLELILDTVIELTEAERGFVLLEDDKGELAVKAARNIDQQSLEGGALDLSRSIARQAATGGGPIVTIDASGDPRFRDALSVSDLHLRSVLAVPLHIKGRAAGTIYVDNRLRKGAFGEDDIQLVLDFSEQAAIAIENARVLGELRRRERQIETLNQRLERELAARKEELTGMKQELRENRGALAIRYDYRNIVGRTPRMMDLFRLLDRLTDTSLPVVIQGESGTGKELVARALHFNGPRRHQPFVSENCAAIPETLLESTLFGAVRGSFTGADHDSRGLFEVADAGTLFLDEVGEMSPGMQGKLLRILQTGELRRVGAERIRKVDVRIIAATNRDLGRMVEEGRFRQDLFFRLSVAPILLPPLRERRDDIALIAEHFVTKLAAQGKGPPKTIEPSAMARLRAYRWPGNIRELENEIMRAGALSTSNRISVSDLSPHVAGDGEAALTTLEDPDSLALKPRVERLERALLREALARSTGNQTKAAESLGLSRFGLQKKLRRYGMG